MSKNKIVVIFDKDENGNYKYGSLEIAKNIDGNFEISSVYNQDLNGISLTLFNKINLINTDSLIENNKKNIQLEIKFAKENYNSDVAYYILSESEVEKIGRTEEGYKEILDMLKKMVIIKKDNYYNLVILPYNYEENDIDIDYEEETKEKSNTKTVQKSFKDSFDINKIILDIKKKIIGQDEAIESIVTNIYVNQMLIESGNKDLISTGKASILLDGSTGTGKTAIIKEVSEKLSLPIAMVKSTDYSTAGYIGADLSNILVKLLDKANGNLKLAQRGIVCMDELDKLGGQTKQRELVMKRAVQHDLLTFIGGAKYDVSYKGKNYEFDTTNLTFIGMGAFTDIVDIKKSKNDNKYKSDNKFRIGFDISDNQTKPEESNTYEIKEQDYIDYGLERELIGRMTLITHTKDYLKEDYINILLNSTISPLTTFIEIVKELGVKTVNYDEEFISGCAEIAYQKGFGVRGLQKIFSDLRNSMMLDIINKKLTEINLNSELLQNLKSNNIRRY